MKAYKRTRLAITVGLLLAIPVIALLASETAAGVWLATIGKPRQTRVARFTPTRPSGLSSECDPVVLSPVMRAGELHLGAGDSLTVAFAGKATRCPGGTVSFFTREDDGEETAQGTAIATTAGAWTKSLAVTDGARTAFVVQMTSAAGRTTRTTVYVEADTSKAVVLVDAPRADDWGYARVVAPLIATGCGGGGNYHVDHSEPGWISDAACAAGGQVDPDVTVRGAVGGTLTVSYDPEGDEGPTVLASASVTATPQRFTATELGQLTLPDWSRGELLFSVEAGAASAEATVGVLVLVTSPPEVSGIQSTMINDRHADVDISYILPAIPAGQDGVTSRATTTLVYTESTRRAAAAGSGSVSIGATPVLVPATEPSRTYVSIENASTTSVIYCALDDAAVTPATATLTVPVKVANNGTLTAQVVTEPCKTYVPCDDGARRLLYCTRGTGATAVASTYRWDSWLPFDPLSESAVNTRQHHCQMREPAATPQVWECDGKSYAPGDRVTIELRGIPPLNVYYYSVGVTL